MCLELTKSEFTQKSIRVFKVFFIRDEKITLPFKDKDQTVFDVCSNRSHGFFDGFGYHSFLSKKNATTYAHIIRTYQPVWIIGMLIPKNSYYSVGKIESGFKGSGIEAVRSEILTVSKAKKIKINQMASLKFKDCNFGISQV